MERRAHPLLVASACLYGAAALPLLFLPDELTAWLGGAPAASTTLVLQVLAGAFLGFAMLNWMSRYSRIGGIFGRPLVLANFALGAVAVPTLARAAIDTPSGPLLVALIASIALLLGFGSRLFGATPVD